MCRHDVTDAEWNAIRVFLPRERNGKPGRPWVSHRMVVNGILWVLHVGGSWRDVPERYGNWSTIYSRFQRWCREGLWDRMMKSLLQKLDASGGIDRSLWCVDGTIIRAHRCAAGALHSVRENPDNEALGRSQGGFGTKLHILTDGGGIPLAFTATPGQNHEAPQFENVMSQALLSIWYRNRRPKHVAGDKGYSSHKIRDWLTHREITPVIPTKSNEKKLPLKRRIYKKRNVVERTIGWLKEHRRIATRYDKTKKNFLAFVKIATARKILKLI